MSGFLRIMSRYAGRGGVTVEPQPRTDQTVRRHYKGQAAVTGLEDTEATNVLDSDETAAAVTPAVQPMDHQTNDLDTLIEPAPETTTTLAKQTGETFAVADDVDGDTLADRESVADITLEDQAPSPTNSDTAITETAITLPDDPDNPEDSLQNQEATDQSHVNENDGEPIEDNDMADTNQEADNSHMITWFPQSAPICTPPAPQRITGKSDEAIDNSHLIDWFAQPQVESLQEEDNSQLIEWYGQEQTHEQAAPTPAIDQPTQAIITCSICGSGVEDEEKTITCADCGTSYHANCWHENMGCASYGCAQVNALAKDNTAPAATQHMITGAIAHRPRQFVAHRRVDRGASWGVVMTVASLVAALVSMVSFGVPSAIVAIVSTVLLFKQQRRFTGKTYAFVMAISVVTCAAGVLMSIKLFTG